MLDQRATAMEAQPLGVTASGAAARPPVLDVVVPVYNEEVALEPSVRRLHAYLSAHCPYPFRITIADNASTDATSAVAWRLAHELSTVVAVRLDEKGRGRALRSTWLASDAPVLAYMDVDLSTDLAALLPLVAPLVSGHSHVAIGSRLRRDSRTVRGAKRELISRGYNVLLRTLLGARFSDAQCGFKAIRRDAAAALLPLVKDDGWFFDTELLLLAQRCGLRTHEVPVDWVDDPDTRVEIVPTALADLAGMRRVGWALATGRLPLDGVRAAVAGARPRGAGGQLVRFATIGIASTLAYLLIFAGLRLAMPAQAANLVALLVTAVANTAVNRRLTFGVRGRAGAWRHQAQGMFIFGLGLALTSGALAALAAVTVDPPRVVELTVLVAANLAGTLLRFVLLRSWVFQPRSG